MTQPRRPTVLLTRPKADCEALSKALASQGVDTQYLPCIQVVPSLKPSVLEGAMVTLDACDWVVWTSRNAVTALLQGVGRDVFVDKMQGKNHAVVGPHTASALEDLGLSVMVSPPVATSDVLAQTLKVLWHAQPPRRVLWPCGSLADSQWTDVFKGADFEILPLEVYQTESAQASVAGVGAQTHLLAGQIDAVVFASPSAVKGFVQQVQLATFPQEVLVFSIGPKTTLAVQEAFAMTPVEAQPHTALGLVQAILAWGQLWYKQGTKVEGTVLDGG